jgi:hypothetical protein
VHLTLARHFPNSTFKRLDGILLVLHREKLTALHLSDRA